MRHAAAGLAFWAAAAAEAVLWVAVLAVGLAAAVALAPFAGLWLLLGRLSDKAAGVGR